MTTATALRIRALQVCDPVARLAAGGPAFRTGESPGERPGEPPRELSGELAGVYAHSVSVRVRNVAGTVLVNLTAAPVETVCQARVGGPALDRLRSAPIGARVLLRVGAADVVATRLAVSGTPRPFAVPPSWFDSPEGDVFGRPRLERAARALVADRDVDSPDELCGLGIGLTPSGDDALVGLIAASSCAGLGARVRRRLAGRLRSGWGVSRTTETSLTSLRLALAGDFSPPVLDLLAALTSPEEQTGKQSGAVARLARHGFSSGADLMAGVNALAEAAASREAAARHTSMICAEGEAS